MVKERNDIYREPLYRRLVYILLIMLMAVTMITADFAYAAGDSETPIREVHKVNIGSKVYCFFVQHNVVLTPAEISEMSDEELTREILSRAGLYMKEENCKKASHKAIPVEKWDESNGEFFLSEDDIADIRNAEPVDGEPVKQYMDLRIRLKSSADPEDEEDQGTVYSTYKRTSPRLLFVAVATETDAAYGEEICEEDKTDNKTDNKTDTNKNNNNKKQKKSSVSKSYNKGGAPAEEMLPEYRTINMADRSGEPVEDTLQDGTPVTLEWIEPDKYDSQGGTTWIDRIPGRYYGLAVIAATLAALIFLIIRRRKKDED